jgi:predicted GNAT family acetyltransferase
MKKYKNVLRNLASKNNFNVIPMGNENYKVRLVYKKNKNRSTYVNVNRSNEPETLMISHGKTRSTLRRQGLGTRMRVLVTLAAKLAGYRRMRQYSMYSNKNQVRNYPNAPPSSRIMNRLGFVQNDVLKGLNGLPVISYVFNFNRMNNKKLRNVINRK